MRTRIILTAVTCILLLTGLLFRFGFSQAQPPQEEVRNEYGNIVFQPALPHLEQVLGHKLPVQPEFRVVGLRDLVRLPGWEVKAFVHWKYPGLAGDLRERAYQFSQQADCLATTARHLEGTNLILVLPENTKEIARWDRSLQAADTEAFLQLTLVHEAAKMALEKRFQLTDRRFDPHSLEEFRIQQAVREGAAQWITREVARRLGTEKYFPLLARRWRHVPDAAPDAQLKGVCQTALQQKHWALSQGLAFVDHLHLSGLQRVEDTVFLTLPRQVAWIDQPQLYLQHGTSQGPDLKALFAAVERDQTPAGHRAEQQPWTPAMLRQVAGVVGMTDQAVKVAEGWEDGRSLVWARPDRPGSFIALTAVKFHTAQAARAYYGFALDLQRQRDELCAKNPAWPLRTLDSRFTPERWAGIEEMVRNDKTVQFGADGPKTSMQLVLARSGAIVVELQMQGVQPVAGWEQRAVQAVLTQDRK